VISLSYLTSHESIFGIAVGMISLSYLTSQESIFGIVVGVIVVV